MPRPTDGPAWSPSQETVTGDRRGRRARATAVFSPLGLSSSVFLAAAGRAVAAGGPTEVSARRVEFRRFDPETGMLALRVSAERASASGELAGLTSVGLTRYGPSGEVVLEVTADSGRMKRGGDVILEGNVRVSWRGKGVLARFRAPSVQWDPEKEELSTDEPVSGTLEGVAVARGKPIGPGERRMELEGRGLVVLPGSDRGVIARDAVIVAAGAGLRPWRATADGGLEIGGLAGGSPVVRLRGPVAATSRGMTARSDSALIHLRRSTPKAGSRDAAGGGDAEGGLELARAWATGHVQARIEQGFAAAGPGGAGSIEVRAEAAELLPEGGGAVFTGTMSDPARAIFPNGVVRGTRVELLPGGVRSDGGARSEFVIEGAPDGRVASRAAAPPLLVECEGPVQWDLEGGKARVLGLRGGVRASRGDVVLRSRRAKAMFTSPSAGSPRGNGKTSNGTGGPRPGRSGRPAREVLTSVLAEGDVQVTSPRFTALADIAEARNVNPPRQLSATPGAARAEPKAAGEDAPQPSFRITLKRRERAEVEFRAGDTLATCMGPAVYDTSSRTAHLSGGVRGRGPGFKMRCEEASVRFRPAVKTEAGDARKKTPRKNGAAPREAPGEPPPDIEWMDLRGGVVVDAEAREGKPARRIRASRGVYDAASGVMVFTGEPAVEAEYEGWVLTDREIKLYVRENRLESASGKLRATKGPGR